MVGLDVHLDLVRQPVPLQEGEHGRRVVVVLVLGRLMGLGLDQDEALEPDPVLVLHDYVHEAAQLIRLPAKVRVQQRVVAFPASPQHIVSAAQPVCGLQHMLHLRSRVREDLRIRVRRGAAHIATVAEQVGRAPQQPDADPLHLRFHQPHDVVEIGIALRERCALGGHVPVMEGEERHAQLLEELERHRELHFGERERVAVTRPRSQERLTAELVGAGPGEAVPVGNGKAEVVLHALAEHFPVRVVPAEGHRVIGARPFVSDLRNVREERCHLHSLQPCISAGSAPGRRLPCSAHDTSRPRALEGPARRQSAWRRVQVAGRAGGQYHAGNMPRPARSIERRLHRGSENAGDGAF